MTLTQQWRYLNATSKEILRLRAMALSQRNLPMRFAPLGMLLLAHCKQQSPRCYTGNSFSILFPTKVIVRYRVTISCVLNVRSKGTC